MSKAAPFTVQCSLNAPMRKLGSIIIVALGTLCLTLPGNAQTPSTTPLYLFTTGSGQISPFQDGQLLTVGQTYELQAISDPGFQFSDWRPVIVFSFTQYTLGPDGNTNTIIGETPSPGSVYSSQPVLDFTMQPLTVLYNVPGVRTVTQSIGWQADFLPTPEPSPLALMAGGLMLEAIWRARRTNASGLWSCWKFLRSYQPKPPSGFKS